MIEKIDVFTHSCIRIRTQAVTVYFDPFHMKEEPRDADFVFVTHDHFDHFSPEDIKKAAGDNCVLIVPEKMKAKAQEAAGLVKRIETVKPGESKTVDGLQFETIPSYNILKPFHPKSAGWVGYILIADGKRIFVAGDTDATKEAKAVRCDIALIPIGGKYTMDAKAAAELVNTIAPEVAIPTHYGSVVGKMADADAFAAHVKAPVKVEFKLQY